jgi:predicted phosphodiesterase
MSDKLKKLPEENEAQYIFRIGQAKDNGLITDTWETLSPILNTELGYEEEDWKGESAWRKRYRNYLEAYENIFSKTQFTESQSSSIEEQKREIDKARMKLQTEKLEYNRWLREEARDELIAEKIVAAVKELKPLDMPEPIVIDKPSRSAVLAFGDEHFSTEFTIYGLYGEIINSYSPEIFEQRMWDLFYKVVDIIKKEDLTTLYVFALGDFTDGILRCSQLMKLRYGVVEGTVKYANFISNWLNELSKYVNIKYQMVFGNHSELRMLGQPKGTFKDDNTGLFVREIIKTRLENNPNFEMTINPTGLIFDNIEGFNVLAIHGEVRNMENAIKDFSSTYNTNIQILIGGHMHHYKAETVGVNREVINVPSVIGIDDYSMTLNKTSNPGASLFLIEENKGVTVDYKIKL